MGCLIRGVFGFHLGELIRMQTEENEAKGKKKRDGRERKERSNGAERSTVEQQKRMTAEKKSSKAQK